MGAVRAIQNETWHSGSSGYPPRSVLSKMRGSILDKVAFPLVWFHKEGGVASRIIGLRPLSGSIQNEGGNPEQVNGGGIPDHGAIPPYLVLSKTRGGSPDQVALLPIWFHPN